MTYRVDLQRIGDGYSMENVDGIGPFDTKKEAREAARDKWGVPKHSDLWWRGHVLRLVEINDDGSEEMIVNLS